MSDVSYSLLERHPYRLGTAMAASGVAIIVPFISKIPLAARLPIGGVGGYGILTGTLLTVTQLKPLSCRDVVLLTAGAVSTALSWYKLCSLLPEDTSNIDSGTILSFAAASIASIAIPFAGKTFDLVRSCCAKRRAPSLQQEALLADAEAITLKHKV